MSKHRTARFREKQMHFLPVKMNVSGIANVPLTRRKRAAYAAANAAANVEPPGCPVRRVLKPG